VGFGDGKWGFGPDVSNTFLSPGWTADRPLAAAQELYDGEGKKLITYPRAEARYLAKNQIGDVPAIVTALTRLHCFAHLRIDPPVIRRGKSGHFSDKALEEGRRPSAVIAWQQDLVCRTPVAWTPPE
jgi:hypothetical protein